MYMTYLNLNYITIKLKMPLKVSENTLLSFLSDSNILSRFLYIVVTLILLAFGTEMF